MLRRVRRSPPWVSPRRPRPEWNPDDNPRIVEYLASVGIRGGGETSWCAAFVNWSLREAAFVVTTPACGCIVVTKPLSAGASGHIGFLHAMDQTNVWLLSGNSANRVRIFAYSRGKLAAGQCLRWPV